jgi:hypothetical protein
VLTVCWSPKGGSGTSVVAVALAQQVAAAGDDCLLVDLAGDHPAILGLPSADRPGLTDWLSASDDVPVDALRSLEVPVVERLHALPRGGSGGERCRTARLELAAALFATSSVSVVVDAGSGVETPRWWPASATTITVVRSCYLALRRLTSGVADARDRGPVSDADRIVLIEEAGRALTRRDVVAAVGDVAVTLPWDPAVARAVDAGLLTQRMPRSLRRLRGLIPATSSGRV